MVRYKLELPCVSVCIVNWELVVGRHFAKNASSLKSWYAVVWQSAGGLDKLVDMERLTKTYAHVSLEQRYLPHHTPWELN